MPANGDRRGIGSELSKSARVAITVKYAKASKKERGRSLDEVLAITGWSQDNARQALESGEVAAACGKQGSET